MYEAYTHEVGAYLHDVRGESVLSREQEVDLFRRLEQGDATARDEIVRSNLRFVIKIACEYIGRGLPLADLIQEGNVGLLEVIPKYNWRKGCRFSTYAAYWIRQAIRMALRHHSSLIRLPIRKSRLLGRMNEVIRQFHLDKGREPTTLELSALMGASANEIERLLRMRDSVISLDAHESEDDPPLVETLAQTQTKSPRDLAAEKQTRTNVARVLGFLGERERNVLRLRFGFGQERSLSLRRASKIIGLSQEGVRRIEQRALEKLRRPAMLRLVADAV